MKGIPFPIVIKSFSVFSVIDVIIWKISIKFILNFSIGFRVNANKANYILSRMPKIVYTEYDIDDEKEESKKQKSV